MKRDLRQKLREILAAIPEEEIRERSIRACYLLCDQPEFKKAEIMMTFLSLAHEIDTSPLVLRAWMERTRVLAPKVSWEQRRMLPIEVTSLTQDIRDTPMGIREPAGGTPIPVANIDLVIVPALGFDALGNRLGRGRGFYDRFLSHRDFRGVACGLAFEEQFVDSVPVGSHDMQVDMLVTDKAVRRFGR